MAEEETKQPTTTPPTYDSLQKEIGDLAINKMNEPNYSDLMPPKNYLGFDKYKDFDRSANLELIKRQVNRVINDIGPTGSDDASKKAFAYAKANIRLFYDDETLKKMHELNEQQSALAGGRKKRRSRRKTRRGGKRRIYRHLAVKAFLKKTKRRRKKKKTNKKKKRKQRTKRRR
jgi:hypothetical protein